MSLAFGGITAAFPAVAIPGISTSTLYLAKMDSVASMISARATMALALRHGALNSEADSAVDGSRKPDSENIPLSMQPSAKSIAYRNGPLRDRLHPLLERHSG